MCPNFTLTKLQRTKLITKSKNSKKPSNGRYLDKLSVVKCNTEIKYNRLRVTNDVYSVYKGSIVNKGKMSKCNLGSSEAKLENRINSHKPSSVCTATLLLTGKFT